MWGFRWDGPFSRGKALPEDEAKAEDEAKVRFWSGQSHALNGC